MFLLRNEEQAFNMFGTGLVVKLTLCVSNMFGTGLVLKLTMYVSFVDSKKALRMSVLQKQ